MVVCWMVVAGRVICRLLLVVDCWSLVDGQLCLVVVGCWSMDGGWWSLMVGRYCSIVGSFLVVFGA